MTRIVQIVATTVAALFGGALQQVLRTLVSSQDLRGVLKALNPLKILKGVSMLDAVGIGLCGLGVASILTSYKGWFLASGPRGGWWQSFHLEIGAGLVFVGAIDTLLMARVRSLPDDSAGA